jgi:hypothetical protein
MSNSHDQECGTCSGVPNGERWPETSSLVESLIPEISRDAWAKQKDLSPPEAKLHYVETLQKA